MADAIHSVTVERGIDPRTFVLYAYGGGGGLFAASTAVELDIGTIVVPRSPATFSAWGILTSEHREDASTTRVAPLDGSAMPGVLAELGSLRLEVIERLADLGFSPDQVRAEPRADLRFEGQEHTVTVDVDPAWGSGDSDALHDAFVARHRQLYGHGDADALVELVTLRCRGVVPGEELRRPRWTVTTETAPRSERPVFFREAGGVVSTRVFDRESLAVGQAVRGPAIIEEWSSTILVPPEWIAQTDQEGNLVLTHRERP